METLNKIFSPTLSKWLLAIIVTIFLFVIFEWYNAISIIWAIFASVAVITCTVAPAVNKQSWKNSKIWLKDNQHKFNHRISEFIIYILVFAFGFAITSGIWWPFIANLPMVFHNHTVIRKIQEWVYPSSE
jgi:hypothetical protein